MKLRRWAGLILAAMAGGVPGCSIEGEPDSDSLTITKQDLAGIDADSYLTLDSRFDSFDVDQSSGEIDFSRILLICPDGTPMQMHEWLEARSEGVQASISDLDAFFIGRTAPPPPECVADNCSCEKCELCPDGMWMCYNTCGEDWDQATQRWRQDHQFDPRLGGPLDPPDDPNDPGDPPPDGSGGGDPGDDGSGSDGSGGSGGSGGSDGSGGSSGGGPGGGGYGGGGGGGGTTNPGP